MISLKTTYIDKAYLKYYLGDPSISAHIDAVHAASPKADKYTDEIVDGVIYQTNCSGIIATVSRDAMDLNRPLSEKNQEAIMEYRETIKEILTHLNILDDNRLTKPNLHLAIHGMRDIYGCDIELGTLNGSICDEEIKDWFHHRLTQEMHDAKIAVDKLFVGDQSKGYHRYGDLVHDYEGYGPNYNTIQIEISRSYREQRREELISVISELIKEFNEKLEIHLKENPEK